MEAGSLREGRRHLILPLELENERIGRVNRQVDRSKDR